MEEQEKGNQNQQQPLFGKYSCEDLLEKLKSDNPTDLLQVSQDMEKLMKKYASKIAYSQFRKVHAEIKKSVNNNNLTDLAKSIPILAYMEARQEKKEAKKLVKDIRLFAECIIKTEDKDNLNYLKTLMDTLVAYHKLHGKNN